MTPYEEVGYQKLIQGTSEKCVFCAERVGQGLEPACVSACTGKARFFGDLDDPQSEVSRMLKERKNFVLNPEMGTEPSCYYLAQKEIR
jgi:molybdopterin-containing oxidoreductase family iron-sulfur binding subunit